MIKLGTVPFLNVRPLVYPLEKGLVEHDFEIIFSPPSNLSRLLLESKVDLGLIPVVELVNRANYSVVPNISICSYGKVDSVVLLTKSSLKNLRNVAVDLRSQSSTALLRIVLEIFNTLTPVYVRKDSDSNFLTGVDGGMLIGDSGLNYRYNPPIGYKVYDLGDIWTKETGLPFVYAVYAVRKGICLGANLEALQEAKHLGLNKIREICLVESKRVGLSEELCYKYLTESIKYDLGENEIKGIMTYSTYLKELKIIKKIHSLKFYQNTKKKRFL